MPLETSVYLTLESFLLSIVILASLILSIGICVLVCFKDSNNLSKYVAIYLLFNILIYQVSSLLSFYSPAEFFQLIIMIKMSSAFLLKTTITVWLAANIRKPGIFNFFLSLHLLSLVLVILVMPSPLREAIIIFDAPNIALYGAGARIYTIVSGMFLIISGLILCMNSPREQKRHYLFFISLFFAFNTFLLVFDTYSSQDVVYEKMHVLVFFVLVAVFFKLTPLFSKKDWFFSSATFMQGIGETVLILDQHNQVLTGHNGFTNNPEVYQLVGQIIDLIDEQELMKEAPDNSDETRYTEGEISLLANKSIHLHYKQSPLVGREKHRSRIIVLRDMTEYTELVASLNRAILHLNAAFKAQKENIRVSDKITREKERARIFEVVNKIARDYLLTFKAQIYHFKSHSDNSLQDKLITKNSELLAMTRNVIDEIRQIVKQLAS